MQAWHGEDLRHVDDIVRKAVARAIRLLDNLSRQGFLIILDILGWPFDLSRVYHKMLEHPGRTVPWHGKSCRRLRIDSCDWPHMAFAVDAGASAMCTTDTAFADIACNDAEFDHLQIQLTSKPLIGLLSGGIGA